MIENQEQPTSAENPSHDPEFVAFLKEKNPELYNYIKDNPSPHYQSLLENKPSDEELQKNVRDSMGSTNIRTAKATEHLIAFRSSKKV